MQFFVSTFWCRVFRVDFSACRVFRVDFSACRVFRVDFSACRVFSVDFSACRVLSVDISQCAANRGPVFPIMKYTFFGVELLGVKLLACTVDQLRPFVNTGRFIQLVSVQFLVQGCLVQRCPRIRSVGVEYLCRVIFV